jgi:hypothetical protein
MDWNEIQNFSSNIVFGILLFAMMLIGLIYLCLIIQIISQKLVDLVLLLLIIIIFYSLFSLDCCWLFSIK